MTYDLCPKPMRDGTVDFEFGVDRFGRIYKRAADGLFIPSPDPALITSPKGSFQISGILILTPGDFRVAYFEQVSLGTTRHLAGPLDVATLHGRNGARFLDDEFSVDWGCITETVGLQLHLCAYTERPPCDDSESKYREQLTIHVVAGRLRGFFVEDPD